MGQRQGISCRSDAGYKSRSYDDLLTLANQRGLGRTRRRGLLQADRSTLIALLDAYDIGADAASGKMPPQATGQRATANLSSYPSCSSDLEVIHRMIEAPCIKGLDIGGTLVKMVLALPREVANEHRYPASFGLSGRTRHDLEFTCDFDDSNYVLRFVSGATAQISEAITNVESLYECLAYARRAFGPSNIQDGDEDDRSSFSSLQDSPLSPSPTSTRTLADCRSGGSVPCLSKPMSSGSVSSLTRSVSSLSQLRCQEVFTAGGGAHKFAQLFREALNVELVPVKELAAVVDGLLFLMLHGPRSGGFFVMSDDDEEPCVVPAPEPLFPFIVVNMGSGISILRVDSAAEGDYVRIGGTACGGGTFLGLARALTSAESFEDALRLAEGGDATKCDLLVRDIYGDEGSQSLGLPGALTASNFGRLSETPKHEDEGAEAKVCDEKDLARSLLQMVTQQSVLLSSAFARHAGCVDRVFFVGGFVEEANHIARKSIAQNFRSLGGRAYFSQHSDYLGALGSLWACLRADGRCLEGKH
mmetsp:Transcript_58509/g.110132  ORF Transcript_58509/g.110132 Transcript_58509/m.110132 type:complete len:531 (+) Transcript_58509:86-1678(+)